MRAPLGLLIASAVAALASCANLPGGSDRVAAATTATPMRCDDGLKTAFRPDAQTRVISVRLVPKGSPIVASDSPQAITTAQDLCLVKLLVGPGATAEKDRSARAWSEGIGMEVWLPLHTQWNERIRNYGGGGWVGAGHRYADQIGSKVPAIVIAGMGYATGTHDGGQEHSQDGSFVWLSNGRVNTESLHDFMVRAQYEQAVKTRALVQAFYGRAPKFAYYDGHSQGGRQGMKVAQQWPQLYDGYLIGQPAINLGRFSLNHTYPQIVMKHDLGFTALDKAAAGAFADKVATATTRAVAACDREKLGFLLDPFACAYNPLKDAAMLCTGVQGSGVVGTSTEARCMSAREAAALNKIWYGASADGSYDPAQTSAGRSGAARGERQLWWGWARGANVTGSIRNANTESIALAMQDVSYAADAAATTAKPIVNTSTTARNRFATLTYEAYAKAHAQVDLLPYMREAVTAEPDLSRLRDGGKKILMWNGLAEDAIPPAGSVNYYERVKAAVGGGDAGVQRFFRMYNIPGMAHSSQGRAYTVGNVNNSVPMPTLPGNANQTPTPAQDQLFTALVDWVEHGRAPGAMIITSRDGSTSHPMCVYPQKITWDGVGSVRQASSFACK